MICRANAEMVLLNHSLPLHYLIYLMLRRSHGILVCIMATTESQAAQKHVNVM